MVTLNTEKQKEAHKKLYKDIFDCDCKPWIKDKGYCSKCHGKVIMFMDDYGAGVLTRDIELEELSKENSKLLKTNLTTNKKLESKIKRVEELKKLLITHKETNV